MSQYLGDISAYALAVSQGYTGTEEEYAELMASYATVGQTAVNAAQTATTKASEAATSATTATNKASEAASSATTATTAAEAAQADADAAALDASQALSAASTATTKATEATTAAATAVSAKDDAVAANTSAQSAKTAAQTAQTGAETAAASVSASAEQIATNAADISQLKSAITLNNETLTESGLQTFALYSNFQRAGLNPNGTLKPEQNYRVSCGDHIIIDKALTVSVASGYMWGYIPFVNGSAGDWSGWKNTDYTIPANTEFVVQIMHTPEQTSVPANVENFVKAVTFQSIISVINGTLYQDYLAYHGAIVSTVNEYKYARSNEIFSAKEINFQTDGTAYSGLSFDINLPTVGNVIHIHSERNVGNDFAIRTVFYDANNSIITNTETVKTDHFSVVPVGAVKLTVTLAACWFTALPSGTDVKFTNISIKYMQANGTGNNVYNGGKIVLTNDNQQINKCEITLWKDFTNVSAYNLHLNESIAIYGGYVFLFNGGGGGIVVDYATKEILSAFSTMQTEDNHQNSAQFTNIYHTNGDEFPLLLVARCGNTDGTTVGKDECLVYRVTRSESTFTFTLVNSIAFDKRTYGTSWGIDNATNTLYVTSTVNGNWSVTTDNPLNYWAFNMPSKSSILSGNAITLTESDVIAHAEADFAVQQGTCVMHGIMFEAVQELNGTWVKDAVIYAVDVFKNQIVSKVPLLINTYEPEGVAVYNGKLYVTQKLGTDTSGTNPLKIYEIEF